MSPSRPAPHVYKSPRHRREVIVAALGVALILAVAIGLIWVLAPHEESPIDPASLLPQTPVTSTTGPATTPTTGAPTTSSAPPG